MRLLPLAVAAILAASLPAQNILTAAGWQHDGVTNFQAKGAGVSFVPFSASPLGKHFRIWQDVKIPATGTYLLRLQGWGGSNGYLTYRVDMAGESKDWSGSGPGYQFVNLAADKRAGDTLRVEMTTTATDFMPDGWWLTIELERVERPLPLWRTTSDDLVLCGDPAQLVAIAPWRSVPRGLSGFQGLLRLDVATLCPVFWSPGVEALPGRLFYMGWLRADVTFWAQSLDLRRLGTAVPVRYVGQ